jgi:hypothetical protein
VLLALVVGFGPSSPGLAAEATGRLCYQRLSGQAKNPDLEQLRLQLDGPRVAGFYRWLPWQKDRRVGQLEGRLSSEGTAKVIYRFTQEGQAQSAPLTIVFNDRQARIRWEPSPQAGQAAGPPLPPVLLLRHPCAELKPVPGL